MLMSRSVSLLVFLFAPLSLTHAAPDGQANAVSPDGKWSAVAAVETIRIFDRATGKEVVAIKGHAEQVTALAYSPDGKFLVSGGKDKSVRIWDAATGRAITNMQGHGAAITEVSVSADGKTITSRDEGQKVIKWDIASGKML